MPTHFLLICTCFYVSFAKTQNLMDIHIHNCSYAHVWLCAFLSHAHANTETWYYSFAHVYISLLHSHRQKHMDNHTHLLWSLYAFLSLALCLSVSGTCTQAHAHLHRHALIHRHIFPQSQSLRNAKTHRHPHTPVLTHMPIILSVSVLLFLMSVHTWTHRHAHTCSDSCAHLLFCLFNSSKQKQTDISRLVLSAFYNLLWTGSESLMPPNNDERMCLDCTLMQTQGLWILRLPTTEKGRKRSLQTQK